MNRTILTCLIVLTISIGLVACDKSGSDKTITLTEEHSGGEVSLKPGDPLVIALVGNPTTGYTWQQVEGDDDVIALTAEPEYTADSDRIGSGGVYVFRFEAKAAGETELRLGYFRPWQKGTPFDESFTISVTVQ